MAANLIDLKITATTMLKVSEANNLSETRAYARYFLGICHYQTNELAEAQAFLDPVVSERSISNMISYVRCSQALSLSFQSMGDVQKAKKVAVSAMDRLLKTANTFYLPLMEAFLAELALRQGRLNEAVQWADGFEAATPQQAYGCFVPELTAVKIRLHQSTPESLRHAGSMLDCLLPFFQSTHNVRWTMEALALQALLHTLNGDESAALSILQRAMALAIPNGFIRLFVDLGPDLARLIHRLNLDDAGLNYAGQIMAAYKVHGTTPKAPSSQQSVSPLPNPLTPRELEILPLLATNLNSREIAKKLFISPGTLKVHTNKIYRKLGVNSRHNAVAKAAGLGIKL
jgi:LuxR family maltose regulon positive regulatory protein